MYILCMDRNVNIHTYTNMYNDDDCIFFFESRVFIENW